MQLAIWCAQLPLYMIPVYLRKYVRLRHSQSHGLKHTACCVWLQRCAPKTFPDHPYDKQEIYRPANLSEFIHQSREMATREYKLRQTSRWTMTWHISLPCVGNTVLPFITAYNAEVTGSSSIRMLLAAMMTARASFHHQHMPVVARLCYCEACCSILHEVYHNEIV